MLKKNKRNSNLEILRIIAMIFIIAFHLSRHGFESVPFVVSNPNNIFLYFFGTLGKLGVDVFILISAYFMIKSKFTFRKLLVLGGSVYFYSIIFLIIFTLFLTPVSPININDLIKCLLPLSHGYWFINDYIILMLLTPFLNRFINQLPRDIFIKLLLLLLLIWSVYPTLTGDNVAISEMAFFVILYFIGSFIRLHVDIDKINMKKVIFLFLISLITTTILFGLFDSISFLNQLSLFNRNTSIIKRTNSIFIVFSAITMFLIFLKKEEYSNKYINYIAGSVLGVYLIHSNLFVYPYLFNSYLHIQTYYYSPNLFIICMSIIILIYVLSTIIDIIRRLTVEKVWIWIVDTKLNNIPTWIIHKYEIFEEKISYYLK